jgi:hypothetical protein
MAGFWNQPTVIVAWYGFPVKTCKLAQSPTIDRELELHIYLPSLADYLPRVGPSARGEYELADVIAMMIDDQPQVSPQCTATSMMSTMSTSPSWSRS